MSSKEDIQRLAREVEAHEPHGIQLLVNNVGIVCDDTTKFLSAGERTKGCSSQVINVSSISGQIKGSSRGQFAYAASKAAITHLSRMLATTFKSVGVKVM